MMCVLLHCSEVDSYQDAWYECEKFGNHLIHFKVSNYGRLSFLQWHFLCYLQPHTCLFLPMSDANYNSCNLIQVGHGYCM